MAYKIGYCPQCNEQIQVRDTSGKWNTRKPNFAQIDLTFESGTKARTIICKTCADNPDYELLIGAILHKKSQAGSVQKNFLENEGLPTQHRLKG